MINILFFITGIVLGFYIKSKIKKSFTPKQTKELDEIREESKEALNERTNHRKEKIIIFMKDEAIRQKEIEACNPGAIHKGVNRLEIDKLLEVSSGTSRKYLNELESENRIKQIGENGRDVYYILNS